MPRVDVNVILRYMVDEPSEQAEQAARLFRRAAEGHIQLTLDEIIVAEIVWTLKRFYHLSSREIGGMLLEFLSSYGVECRDDSNVRSALALIADKNIDFGDALVSARMLAEGELDIYTFDHDFDRIPGIHRLTPG